MRLTVDDIDAQLKSGLTSGRLGPEERAVLEALANAPLLRREGVENVVAGTAVVVNPVNLALAVEYFTRYFGVVPDFFLLDDDLAPTEAEALGSRHGCGTAPVHAGLVDPLVFGRKTPYRRDRGGFRYLGCRLGLHYGISRGVYIDPDAEPGKDAGNFRLAESEMFSWAFVLDRLPDIARIHARLADAESRAVFVGKVRAHLSGNSGYIPVSGYLQYYHPLIQPEMNDVVCEGGASDGATTLGFAGSVGCKGHVHAFEPLPDGYSDIAENTRGIANISVERSGLWSRAERLRLRLNGTGSTVTEAGGAGTVECEMTALDSFLADRNIGCDYFKLDIEGAEPEALAGAVETIRGRRPKLAISIYHKPYSQLFDIPLAIVGTEPGYRLYMGHHDITQDETVLYADCMGKA